MADQPLRLATFAVPLSGNKGSASMLLGLIDSFAHAGIPCHFDIFSYYPREDAVQARGLTDASVHPGHPKDLAFACLPAQVLRKVGLSLSSRPTQEAVEAVRKADAILAIGGTTFADSMLYKVPWNVLAMFPGWLERKPILFLSQTLGPTQNLFNRLFAKWALGRAREVHGRGRISEGYARALGAPGVRYEPDLSFAMSVPDFADVRSAHAEVARFSEAIAQSGRPAIGVAPNSIVLQKARSRGIDYVQFLVQAMTAIHELGYFPVLIPHSYRAAASDQHNNDRFLCQEVQSRLPAGLSHHFVDADLGSRELRSLIGELHLLVASRFHSMISALSREVPPLTFGWGAHKYSEVLVEFGLEDHYQSFRDLGSKPVGERIAWALGQRDSAIQRIRKSLPGIREQALGVARRITGAIR